MKNIGKKETQSSTRFNHLTYVDMYTGEEGKNFTSIKRNTALVELSRNPKEWVTDIIELKVGMKAP